MKKILLLLIAVLLCSSAFADDFDLSSMSFDDLVSLRERINLAIWNSQEWQEVRVPAGVWLVGSDIPAAHWIIRPLEDSMTQVYYCEKVLEVEKLPDNNFPYHTVVIISEKTSLGKTHPNEVDYNMKDGWYFICNDPVLFTPYTGKPDLGFH